MTKGKVLFGTIVGAVAGFAAGLLTAPKSGKETRKDLKDAGAKAKDTAVTEAAKLKKTVTADVEVAKEVVDRKAQQFKTSAEDVIGDVGEKAEDLKDRSVRAFEGAKEGFSKNPKSSNKK